MFGFLVLDLTKSHISCWPWHGWNIVVNGMLIRIQWNMDNQLEWNDMELVGGVKHLDYFPFHIWDVIPIPLTNSIIFQDDYCTTNQMGLKHHPISSKWIYVWVLTVFIIRNGHISYHPPVSWHTKLNPTGAGSRKPSSAGRLPPPDVDQGKCGFSETIWNPKKMQKSDMSIFLL